DPPLERLEERAQGHEVAATVVDQQDARPSGGAGGGAHGVVDAPASGSWWYSHTPISERSWSMSPGLVMESQAPEAMARSRSPCIGLAVAAMMGSAANSGRARMARMVS